MEDFRRQDFPPLTEAERQLLQQGNLAAATASYYNNLSFLGVTVKEAKAVIDYEFDQLPLMQLIHESFQEYRRPAP
jgi:hypothetical protein